MNSKITYGLQNVPKVISFDKNTLFFVQTICDLKSKIVSYHKWVIWYMIKLIKYFEP